MAKEDTDRSDELTDPNNPPRVLLQPDTTRAALWSYLGPVIALFAIVGVALIYWVNKDPIPTGRSEESAIGTVGRQGAGGGDPQSGFDNARDEIAHRGGVSSAPAGDDAIASVERVLSTDPGTPRAVMLRSVVVDRVQGNSIWVGEGVNKVEVTTSTTPSVDAGERVTISGTTERDQRGAVRIRGSIVGN